MARAPRRDARWCAAPRAPRLLPRLLALLLRAPPGATAAGPPLEAAGTVSMRRVLAGDEVREYAALELRFAEPLYARACAEPSAVFVAAAGRCATCPEGCVLSSLFTGRPLPPGAMRPDGEPECFCGVSYEELRLRMEGWPGDAGVEDVERKPAHLMDPPSHLLAYATALWQYDALMVQVTCPNQSWPEVQRFGLNGLPVAESLWWLRRFETAFGLEDVDALLANASREYDERQAVFFVPVRRTRNGRIWQLGPEPEVLGSCRLEFPYLAGPHGEPVSPVAQVRDFQTAERPCSAVAVDKVRKQVEAVLAKLPSAAQQEQACHEDWHTSIVPDGAGPGSPAPEGPAAAGHGAARAGRQLRRVGSLAAREDFGAASRRGGAAPACGELRWQLRARAHYLRERALAYTATDAASGCWELLEGLVAFEARPARAETDECPHPPGAAEYWASPCCNPRALRERCCAVRNATVLRPVAVAADAALLGRCRADPAGGAAYARRALAAALAWRRRLARSSGAGSCWRGLMRREQAHAGAWRALQRCHADVAGRYDRELRMHAGAPCLADEDCLTRCVKPTLRTLQVRQPLGGLSEEPRQLLGRCHVPTRSRHVYLLRCLVQRAGAEVLELLARGLGVPGGGEEAAARALREAPGHLAWRCAGPYAAPGVSYTEQSCLAAEMCNWNHEIDTRAECQRSSFQNDEFCGCLEGFCFQQSLKDGCLDGTKINDYCYGARELLRSTETTCAARATTPAEMSRCIKLANAHSRMLRQCLARGCGPPQRLAFSDERCVDIRRRHYASCHEHCTIPSGPNPSADRRTCFIRLQANESALDCYKTPGDVEVHYSPRADRADLTLALPEHRKPDYCSVRAYRQLAPVEPVRSRTLEARRFATLAAEAERRAAAAAKGGEGAARAVAQRLARSPPAPASCDMGTVPLEAAAERSCRARPPGCCLSRLGALTAACVPCAQANATLCHLGAPVEALWRPNMQPYAARLALDVGGGLALVDWADGGTSHRQVPWAWITRGGVLCVPVTEGCAAHAQCGPGEYCFGCDLCAQAHGGNPPPQLCAPCPAPRGGACGRASRCQRLQDGVDGTCPPGLELQCPCKEEWSVRFQYEGAPTELSIMGCWYDKVKGYHWCEVDGSRSEQCEAERIIGADRFIFWRRCTPASCAECNCDCSRSCTAYHVVPVEGRPPAQATGDLGQALPPQLLAPAGLIAPNCSDGSPARIRGLCNFCVSCCATFCHSQAQARAGASSGSGTNSTRVFDCTATDVTGCSDSPRGWMDSAGRSCKDYSEGSLCTPGGQFGTNWAYNPPRSFADFRMNGRSATDACCACGGGGDCSDRPTDWRDPGGVGCEAYAERGWCNRTGYGPQWQAAWGPAELGTGGVDALSACCSCGGGQLVAPPAPQALLVDDVDVCARVWPGRASFQIPPWQARNIDHCRLISGICMRKLTALKYTPGLSTSSPDDPRIYGLCEQRAFRTGKLPLNEDFGRQLAALDQSSGRAITPLQQRLQQSGAGMDVDFWGNSARGMCFYRLPDPFGLFGGPGRGRMPPPWPPPRAGALDVFEPPGIGLLGWPSDFWRALPESDAALRRPTGTSDEELAAASAALRAALAAQGVELVLPAVFDGRLAQWQAALSSVACAMTEGEDPEDPDLSKYRRDVYWDPAQFADQESCARPRCDMDDRVEDAEACEATGGCTASCAYCASRQIATHEQGLCYTSHPPDVAQCGDLGGVLVDGQVFDERLGVSRVESICALPHRPLLYCTAPGEQVKRCAHFDVDHCESDPLARLLGCGVGLRRCQTRDECHAAGRCSDVDVGLTWALPGTCVVTPVDDEVLRRGCDAEGLCYSRLDPPFGMEARWRHGLLDLLEPEPGAGGAAAPAGGAAGGAGGAGGAGEAGAAGGQGLRSAGRLNRTECEALRPGPGRRAVWLQRAGDILACRRWHGCCLAERGGVCQLFSGPVVDEAAEAAEAASRREECARCGGSWSPVFRWDQGVWRAGKIEELSRKWFGRRWASANEWVEVVDINVLRQLFENAAEKQLGVERLNAAKCLLEPLLGALSSVAAACGTSAASTATVDHGASPASQLPSTLVPLGSIGSTPGTEGHAALGGISLSWHEFSTSAQGTLTGPGTEYELALVPLEFELAMAAPQIALPSRAEDARAQMIAFAMTGETTTTPPPSYETNRVDAGDDTGYPSWLINEMVDMENPGQREREEAQREAALIADAQARRQQRLRLERSRAAAADASSGLPAASRALLTGAPPPPAPALSEGALDLENGTCRSTVVSAAGEVVGQLLGDCVHLGASAPLVNAVELCLPVAHGSTLEATPQGAALGVVLDFARRELVPEAYNVSSPSTLALGAVPGQLGGALWLWESGPKYGRLPPGWSLHTPLDLEADLRTGGGGVQLCARVFHAGWTYCPVARLAGSIHGRLPPVEAGDGGGVDGGDEAPPLDTSCPQLDAVLAPVQDAQALANRTSAPYQRVDMQVSHLASSPGELLLPPTARATAALCPAGRCLAMRGPEFKVVPQGAADCILPC